jgi:predicted DNA-binding WGR domain protein
MIVYDVQLMHHEGGTKFYEVAMFQNADNRHCGVVCRWGDMRKVDGGGQTKIIVCATNTMAHHISHRKIQEKKARGYRVVKTTVNSDSKGVTFAQCRKYLSDHYDDLKVSGSVIACLSLDDEISVGAETEDFDEHVAPPQPKSEPVRHPEWGSW